MQKLNKQGIKIVLTGGHAGTPGLAVIEELKKRSGGSAQDIYWIGSKYAFPGSVVETLEYKIYPTLGVKFYSIEAGKLQTKFTKHTIPSLLRIPGGFVQALMAILKIRPKVVLSFGGSASFPVVFWAWVLRIPVVLHEQTVAAGRANLAASNFATKIALSRKESLSFFPKEKSIVTGNPLMTEIVSIKQKTTLSQKPVILVMGGSRGSSFINEEIVNIAPKLLKKYKLIHISGEAEYQKIREFDGGDYKVLSFVDPREMYRYYEMSDLIISRSGANTVSEITFIKRPSILIPLPRTYLNEQIKNAKYAEDYGIAKVMLETEVNPDSLTKTIEHIFENWHTIVGKTLEKESLDARGAANLVDLLLNYI